MTAHSRRATLTAVITIGVLALAGCSAAQRTANALPAQNRAQWVTPLDTYVPQKLVAASYAETLLDGQCMQKAGFANWAVPWRESNPDPGPSWNLAGTRLFNQQLAKQYGYHSAPAVRSDTNPAWDEFVQRVNTNTSDAEDAAFVSCQDQVRKDNPLVAPDAGSMNLALGYMAQASEIAKKAQPVLDAAAKWRTCMEPEGVTDLPGTPQEMPPASLRARFGLGPSAPGASEGAPTAEEIRLATVDARCQDSSGFQPKLYTEVWNETTKLYRDNFDALERAKAKLKRQDRAAQEVINTYAPRPNP